MTLISGMTQRYQHIHQTLIINNYVRFITLTTLKYDKH